RTGISQSRSNAPMSPLQQVAAIHIERFTIPEHRNHQSQSDRGFSGRDNQHKENENLTADLSMLAGKGDEGQIDGVQHDFHRQEQGNDVPLQEKSQHADEEQDRSNDEKPGSWNHRSFFAKTTAPTSAISISSDVTSNGNKYSLNKLSPIALGLPTNGAPTVR